MGQFRDLLLHGLDQLWVGVANGHYADSTTHVDHLVAVYVLQNRTVCFFNEGCQHGSNAGRDNLVAALEKLC